MLKRLSTEARQNEVDKYKLHVDEVDKITSLLLGLSSRLARSEISLINLKKNCNEDEEVREKGYCLLNSDNVLDKYPVYNFLISGKSQK